MAAAALIMHVGVSATVVDLTTAGSSGSVNGALFEQTGNQPTGSGVIESFVRLDHNDGDSMGYNTTNEVWDTGATDTFNHELLISDVPVVNIGGVDYLQFLLDINENRPGTYLSLDEVQIFVSGTANQSVTSFTGAGLVDFADASLVYQLDDGEDSYIHLNYLLNPGSGGGDMFMYVDASLFDPNLGSYIYLYSEFGGVYSEDAGFEEWAVIRGSETVVPEPATLSLMGLGLAAVVAWRKRRG